jgi:peptide/nickel transport system substrate-binding protein
MAGHRTSRIIVLALVVILVFTGCKRQDSPAASNNLTNTDGAPKQGGKLVIGIESEIDVVDPHRAGGWVSWRVNRQIFEPLVDEDLSKPSAEASTPPLRPGLAEKWEISDDGLTYTFHIRPNVKFHDGTSLDAKAVDFNIRRMWDKTFEFYDARSAAQTTFVWSSLKSVEVVDPMTIKLTMKKPFSPFLRLLAQGGAGSTAILSPDSLKKYGNDGVDSHPVGTGPFKFVERVRGQKIVLQRNDNYWGEKPYLDQVIFRPLSDSSSRVSALQSGEVDIISVPPPDSIDKMKTQGFNVVMGDVPHVWYLQFNFNDPIMQNKKVRQAIIMSINRDQMAHDLLKDTVKPAYSLQAPGNEAYDPELKDYPYDPEKAKQLLAEAGYPNGFETIMLTSVDGSGQILPVPMAESIQQDLSKVGIKIKLETYEWIAYLSKWAQGMTSGYGWSQQSWGMTTPFWLYIVTNSSLAAPNGPNVGNYKNPELDKIEAQAIATLDQAEAIKLWKQANRIVSEDAALAPIVNDRAPYLVSPKVHNFIVPAEEWYDLNKVWLSK